MKERWRGYLFCSGRWVVVCTARSLEECSAQLHAAHEKEGCWECRHRAITGTGTQPTWMPEGRCRSRKEVSPPTRVGKARFHPLPGELTAQDDKSASTPDCT